MIRQRRLTPVLFLSAIVAALAYVNWMVATESIDASALVPTAKTSLPASEQATPDEKTVALSDLSETIMRPLFTADRRPAPPRVASQEKEQQLASPAASSADANASSKLRLLGMINDGQRGQRALIQADNATSANWISVGGEVSGWRLTNIDGDRAVVEASGARNVLQLYPVGGRPATAE